MLADFDAFGWESAAKMAGELLGGTDLVPNYYNMSPLEWFEWFEGELNDQAIENMGDDA